MLTRGSAAAAHLTPPQDLEAAVIETIEKGSMTKDLAICVHGTSKVTPDQYLNTVSE
jgi:isocitrate dehydrogenase